MKQNDFLRFLFQSKIIPNLCSQSEFAKIFRHCTKNLPQESNIPFEEFQSSMFFLALISFGRPHYSTKYITAAEKLSAFFHLLDIQTQIIFMEGPLVQVLKFRKEKAETNNL